MASELRPAKFDDIIGQESVKQRLRIMIAGCTGNEVMPHILLDGPPGLGKTTLSNAIGNELGVKVHTLNAATIRNIKSIIPYLMSVERGSVVFIDEIHRLPTIVEEFLYPVMEDFRIDLMQDNEDEGIDIPPFCMIGATTNGGNLSQPFYDRFTIKEHLQFYTPDELANLARSSAAKMGLQMSDDELLGVAERSKGTPRICNARLKWFKSYVNYHKRRDDVDTVFNEQGIDKHGFDINDRKYVEVLKSRIGQPLGLKAISTLCGIAEDTITNSIEPYMIRKGFVVRTPKGRVLGKIK